MSIGKILLLAVGAWSLIAVVVLAIRARRKSDVFDWEDEE